MRGWASAPQAVLGVLRRRGVAVVALQRIAAGRDEIDHGVEIRARQRAIGRGRLHLRIQLVRVERRRARHAQHMLRQHVEPAVAQPLAVEFARHHRLARRFAFQHLEAVGGHQQRAARLVQAVIGAADALHQPRGALGRTDADHFVDRAPVDAEIERRGADHSAQIVRLAIAASTLRRCAGASEP